MKSKKAFTLIELLVVIAIISLLVGILMPSLVRVRDIGRQVVCISNMRQMVIASSTYAFDNDQRYPLAKVEETISGLHYEREWDFTKTYEFGQVTDLGPGFLWQDAICEKIQQCPAYKGIANSAGDTYTGYNYNSSYIGGQFHPDYFTGNLVGVDSAKMTAVRMPSLCAIFGDGQYANGANKYMRAPFVGTLDVDLEVLRPGGTQGYRHANKTNVAYCDGSAKTVADRFTKTYSSLEDKIADGTGFLSSNNSAYDLK